MANLTTHIQSVSKKVSLLLGGILLSSTTFAQTIDPIQLKQFADEMVSRHKFDRTELNNLLSQADYKDSIIKAITRPAEGKPWHEYRPIFLTQNRIEGGVEFWNKHQATLERAEKEFGVPAEIIVAIIGVETRYGGYTGTYRVLDSLATLAFHYPKRGKFFRSELEQFLILAREEKLDPLSRKGSYAGAMGMPQFISSSYRRYAIDFDGDGVRDLWNSTEDIIGSVANYFSTHHWKPGQSIAYPATTKGGLYKSLLQEDLKPISNGKMLRNKAVYTDPVIDDDTVAALLAFEGKTGEELWVTLHNFYVITRYNHSRLYAMAVYQLSQEIRAARHSGA